MLTPPCALGVGNLIHTALLPSQETPNQHSDIISGKKSTTTENRGVDRWHIGAALHNRDNRSIQCRQHTAMNYVVRLLLCLVSCWGASAWLARQTLSDGLWLGYALEAPPSGWALSFASQQPVSASKRASPRSNSALTAFMPGCPHWSRIKLADKPKVPDLTKAFFTL